MSPAGFLLIALVVGILGTLVVLSRNRQAQRPESAMDDFRREMAALAPPSHTVVPRTERTRLPFRPRPPWDDAGRGPHHRGRPDPRSGAGSDAR